MPPRSPLPPSAIVTATADLESLVVVPLTNLASVEAVKDVIMTRLHIADEDMPRHTFYLTRIGAGEGRPVSDEELWSTVKACARGDGPQITVFVKEVTSPRPGHWSPEDGRNAVEFASAASFRMAHHRDRETSRSSGSGGRPPSPNSAASFHRQKSPSVSSRASETPCGLVQRETARPSGYEEPSLASRRQQAGSTVAVPPRQASSSSYASQRLTTSPQSASTILSPPADSRFGHGHQPLSSMSTTPKTSPEEYFQYPSANQLVTSPPASASLSPPALGPQGYHSSSSGFAGTPRRLPPAPSPSGMPDSRTQSVPVLQVTSSDWSRSITASTPQHAPSLPAPSSYSQHPPSSYSQHPPRALPNTDPRANMRQYANDPYRNLPLPSNQSPYHNLSLQGQSSVVHLPQQPRTGYPTSGLPPRAATLAAPTNVGLLASRSADNLRGTYEKLAVDYSGSSRAPASRVTPSPVGRPSVDSITSSGSGSNPASAFYSAPVQAQQQTGSSYTSRILPQALSPQSARSEWPGALERPSSAAGYLGEVDRVRARQDSNASSNGGRSRSGTVYELERRFDSQLSLPGDRQTAHGQSSVPAFADDDGAYDGLVDTMRTPHHPSVDAIANSSNSATSPPSSTRSSLTGPITPASDGSRHRFSLTPATVEKPRLVDEFGDPLDEETGTWFPVNQPAASTAPPPPSERKASQTSAHSVSTTAVPTPAAYGLPSPSKAPTNPPTPAPKPADRRSSVPDAQDWTQTILSRFGASSATEGGTLLPVAATGTLRPDSSSPSAAASAPNTPKLVDEFGDELDDSATFFPGHGPSQTNNGSSFANTGDDKDTALSNRPSLRLRIGSNSTPSGPQSNQSGRDGERSAGRGSAGSEQESSRREGAPTTGRRSDGSASSARRYLSSRFERSPAGSDSPFARRNSLAARASDDNDWAFRPPVETVLEHLDVFFPEHDLDKPVFDLAAPSPPGGSTSASSPVKDQPLASHTRRSNLGYHKSIRVVAQDRKRMLQKAGRNVATAASGLASNLLRRRSTKLFGAKIEEVTSAQMNDIDALRETSNDDPENCKCTRFPLNSSSADFVCPLLQSRTSGSRET